ncbi:MAG: glycosyl hydrolase family 28-related protein [Kiritimatiellaeota bacterium]|nr:glycosyl hydrolase family 28-related protein [Kiritimatiellota bacterium]
MKKVLVLGLALLLAPWCGAAEVDTATVARISVRAAGARGDGMVDDSAAFQRAFEQAAAAQHAIVQIPAGKYRLDRQVSVKFAGGVGEGLAVVGEGQGVSVLVCNNTNGALKIRNELCKTQVTIRDLTLLAALPDAGTALEVTSSHRGVRNYRTLLVQNVDMRGEDLPTHKFFSRGLLALAQWRPLFENVVFGGALDPKVKQADPASDALYHKPEFGFAADWSYAPTFQHCYAWSCRTGFRLVSREGAPEGPEDGVFQRCTAVGTRIGIDVDTPTIEPQLVIENCHLNCREVGIRLRNRKFFHITNCLLYGETSDQQAYTDIQIQNCWAGRITGNIFHAPTVENLRKDPPAKRVGVAVDKLSRDVFLSGNIFNAKGLAVAVESGARNIKSEGNQFINPHVEGRVP